ncbi:MAG: DUF2846 domain-containing protein [Burkholderiales bacterium]|nr:DUF2846 domain-containing protein [Burkholderiales bacterium]
MLFKRALIAAFTMAVAGCALVDGTFATGPTFKPTENISPNEAVVYIYRDASWAIRSRAARFYINDVHLFSLDQLGYSWVSLPAGHYTLRQGWPIDMMAKSIQLELDVKPGQVRYFSFRTGVCPKQEPHSLCMDYRLQEQPASIAQPEIADKRFQENFGLADLRQTLSSK